MDPTIDLAPGAEESSLAAYFSNRVKRALEKPRFRKSFFSIRAAVFAVDFDSGDSVTLRFDHGRLTIHEGTIGLPTITFGGPMDALLSLHRLRLTAVVTSLASNFQAEWTRLRRGPAGTAGPDAPPPSSPPSSLRGGAPIRGRDLMRMVMRGDLKIYGLSAHPRLVSRFLALLAAGDVA